MLRQAETTKILLCECFHRKYTHIVHAKQFLELFTQSILWLRENLEG